MENIINEFNSEHDDIFCNIDIGNLDQPNMEPTNICRTLSSLKTVGESITKIRVVVVRVYPTLFRITDATGTHVLVNQMMFEKMLPNKPSNTSPGPLTYQDIMRIDGTIKRRMMTVRVVDVEDFNKNDWSVSATINLPCKEGQEDPVLVESEIFEFQDLKVGGKTVDDNRKILIGNPSWKSKRIGREGLINGGDIERRLTPGFRVNDPDFAPPFYEFDYIGMIYNIGQFTNRSGQQVDCITQDETIISIGFKESIQQWDLESVVKRKNVVGFKNLSFSNQNISANNKTEILFEPDVDLFKNQCERLKIDSTLMKMQFFDDYGVKQLGDHRVDIKLKPNTFTMTKPDVKPVTCTTTTTPKKGFKFKNFPHSEKVAEQDSLNVVGKSNPAMGNSMMQNLKSANEPTLKQKEGSGSKWDAFTSRHAQSKHESDNDDDLK